MNIPQKSREEIKAEREAKKAAKAAAKAAKGKNVGKVAGADNNVKNVSPVTNCKSPEKNLAKDVAGENGKEAAVADVKNKPTVENCNISEQSTKTDAATIARDSQPAGEVSAESTIHFSKVATQDDTSKDVNKEKIGGKSKAELKAERRAKQEAQRAAKQQLLVKDSSKIKEPIKPCVETKSECTVKKDATKSAIKEDPHQLSLFKHLYHERENSRIDVAPINPSIHPAMVRLGVQYESKVIVGSNARCVALLAVVKRVVQDFEKPAQADFIRGLDESLQQSLKYLHHCRPLAVSQHNAMRHLKWQMTRLSSLSDKDVNNFAY